MARGKSGRVVIEMDAEVKRRLYAVLAERSMTLKEWFLYGVDGLLEEHERARRTTGDAPAKDRSR